jgi:HD-GYP domain-containing protein (c-di-GMP phosphodiesterase class II)
MDALRLLALQQKRPMILGEDHPLAVRVDRQIVVQPMFRGTRLVGVLCTGDKHGEDPQVSSYDTQLIQVAASYIEAFLDNASLYADQQDMFVGSIRALTASIDAKDRYTRGHSERVAMLARDLAIAVGLDSMAAERVHICGLLHDVGKIGVPEAVLCKPGRLTDDEFALIKKHPEIGHRILTDIPLLGDILPGVLHHHERWDGRGYPHGLRADAIPLIARLIGLADTFDAMSSTRSYRDAMPRHRVLDEIRRSAGTQLDPVLVEAFAAVDLGRYDEMVARHAAAAPDADIRQAA